VKLRVVKAGLPVPVYIGKSDGLFPMRGYNKSCHRRECGTQCPYFDDAEACRRGLHMCRFVAPSIDSASEREAQTDRRVDELVDHMTDHFCTEEAMLVKAKHPIRGNSGTSPHIAGQGRGSS